MLGEFKKFIMKGNVLDLATAVIIGGAFGTIVTSLVNDVLMPPIGLILGKVDFKELFLSLDGKTFPNLAAAKAAGAPVVAYGLFLNTIVNFLIVAGAIFAIIRTASRLQTSNEEPAPAPPSTRGCPYCRTPISLDATRCPQCTSYLILHQSTGA